MAYEIFSKATDIIAGLIFLPCGLLFGYNIFLLPVSLTGIDYLPHFMAAISALLLAIIIRFFKRKQLVFYHFYTLFISSVLLAIAGLVIIYADNVLTGSILGSIGFGVAFISGLNYIYIRSKPENRSFNLSLCHLWFLIGIAISFSIYAVLISFPNLQRMNERIGGIITGSSIFIGILIIINEILNSQNGYNYKNSWDLDVNRENENNQIFNPKHFHITKPKPDSDGMLSMWSTHSWGPSKQLVASISFILIKIPGLFMFYYPFYMLTLVFGILNLPTSNLWITYWLPVIGAFIGTVLLRFISARIIFILSSLLQITLLIIFTVLFNDISVYSIYYSINQIHILLCLLLVAFGLGFSTTDILILDSASLQSSELFLGTGFFFQFMVLGIIQPVNSEIFNLLYMGLNPYFISITCIIFLSLFVTFLLVPKNFKKSILEIRNTLNGLNVNNPITYPIHYPNPNQNQNPYNYNNQTGQQFEQPGLNVNNPQSYSNPNQNSNPYNYNNQTGQQFQQPGLNVNNPPSYSNPNQNSNLYNYNNQTGQPFEQPGPIPYSNPNQNSNPHNYNNQTDGQKF